ncbi:prostaglandin E receptor 4 (subtype EP4) a [Denticeps clupeoides]|uniref:Prostaglandin E2 receptor EP4 subtype n=1 Tax=Denticeps clupeoides TaxID=299321 RepID=A0AAY4CBL1_9TELE|nr:prostaglandin E2 receptor EP4 subtype-like [Denticeps clupeoides]
MDAPGAGNGTASQRGAVPTVNAVMFVFGVAGNAIAIVVLCKSRREQKETTFYTLVCGLAVTDLLGTVLASPVTIATYVKGSWPDGEPLCQYFGFVLLFFSLAGLSIICAMSVERYLAINHAYFHNDHVSRRLAAVALLAIYASNVLFCALPAMGFGRVTMQYPRTWCFVDWRSDAGAHAAYTFMYAGVSALLILGTVACNVLVCGALIRMHRRFVRRTSLGTEPGRGRGAETGRRRSLGRLAGAEIQMVLLLICTSAVILFCSIPLVVQVFINQLYKTEVEKKIEKNPDLQAIRIASVNPILDPWIYILLRKSVLQKLVQNIKCLFCKIGGRRGQTAAGPFNCKDAQQLSSIISRDEVSLVSRELKEVSSTSQTLLYLPEGLDGYVGSYHAGPFGNDSPGKPSPEEARDSSSSEDLTHEDKAAVR